MRQDTCNRRRETVDIADPDPVSLIDPDPTTIFIYATTKLNFVFI